MRKELRVFLFALFLDSIDFILVGERSVSKVPDVSLCTDETVAHALKFYGNTIVRLSYSYLHNLSDAEDVLQDTLLSLMRNKPAFSSPEHEKAWLMRVAINLCKNKLKSSWFKTIAIPENLQIESITVKESEVLEAVHTLPVKYREVVHLYYYEGYSTFEISSLLQKKESTVRSLLYRARDMLKKTLKGAYDFEE
ncbi:ECF RNA polymerase sigma factor SigW [Brevibacillus laterosporus]|nr:sigma-70 family RNA polymerase sigma factor [Brevibacillus laterosporus]MBM7110997.1 ECF RNA polymerase sigma factor SigW [Brevibacillus laterosporus]